MLTRNDQTKLQQPTMQRPDRGASVQALHVQQFWQKTAADAVCTMKVCSLFRISFSRIFGRFGEQVWCRDSLWYLMAGDCI